MVRDDLFFCADARGHNIDIRPLPHLQSPLSALPSRPIRLLVGFSPGGASDVVARYVGRKLTDTWAAGRHRHRAGAAGILATELTAKANPDGHTLLFISSSFLDSAQRSRRSCRTTAARLAT